jgi:DNA-binding transcriptional regulator/RsmH inhibitor MraZ
MTAEPVPAGPVTVEPPDHPLHALATYELSRYRRELEHALEALPQHAAVRELLIGKLAEVLAEQDSRVLIAEASAR